MRITLEDIDHPNLKLDELKKITKKKAIQLFRKGKYSENITQHQLIKSIIMAASRVKWSTTDPRGIREFWYNPVKPIFYRIYGAEIDNMDESSITGICDTLSHTLSIMVQSKIVSYEDLGIVDFRTRRMLWESIENADCWKNIILFVEKDSAYIHLRPLKNLLNISLISGAGVSKTALNEYLENHLPKGKYKLFTFTDYDPWGFFISGECFEKLKRMGWDIDIVRIGLDVDQVDEKIRDNQKYPVKMDHNGRVWAPKYGIVGRLRTVYQTKKSTIIDEETGKKKKIEEEYLAYKGRKGWGLEIEAISGQKDGAQKLREIVLDQILEHLDEEQRLREIRNTIWYSLNSDYECLPINEYDKKYYKQMTEPEKITTYITRCMYNKAQRLRQAERDSDIEEPTTDLDDVNSDITRIEDKYDEETTTTEDEYNSLISLITHHLRVQIEQLEKSINMLEEPLLRERDEKLAEIGTQRQEELEPYELDKNEIQAIIDEIESAYERDNNELFKVHRESGYLRVESNWSWYDSNYDSRYEDESPNIDELSFGLKAGVHMDELKENEGRASVERLINIASNFDISVAEEYIHDNIEENEEIQEEISEKLTELIDDKTDRMLEVIWYGKWRKYLEMIE